MMRESRRRGAGASFQALVSILGALVLLAGSPEAARAECPDEPWAELVFNDVSDESDEGIGGSGLGPGSGDPEDGIGGSGFAPDEDGPDGIGGSGIYGTVTGFGSLCVNGLRVRYDDSAEITIDAERGEHASLAVGQVVRIDAEVRDGALFAPAIEIEHEIVGPVTAWAGGELEVMGERVRLGPGALASEKLAEKGARVAVSGLRRADGTIVASRVDRASVAGDDLVRGASLARDGVVVIGRVAIDARDLPGNSTARGRVVVRGRWRDSEGFVARRLEASPRFDAAAANVIVEGYGSVASEGRVRVGDLDLLAGEELGASLESTPGEEKRLRIRARRDSQGLRVQAVERLDERPLMQSLDRGWHGGRPKLPRDSGLKGRPDRPKNPRDSRSIDRPERPQPQRDRVEPGRGRGRGPGSTGPPNPRPGRGNPNPGGGGRGRGRGR